MRYLALFCSVFFAGLSWCQMVELRVNASAINLKQCRRAESLYEITINGSFDVENTSNRTLLVPKIVDHVRTLAASVTQKDLEANRYAFVMNQEFGASHNLSGPKLEDFIVIKPGGTGRVELDGIVATANAMTGGSSTDRLHPGKYWMEFKFLPLPSSFPTGQANFTKWQKRWKSTGLLVDHYLWTEPFPVDVVIDPGAPRCDSE